MPIHKRFKNIYILFLIIPLLVLNSCNHRLNLSEYKSTKSTFAEHAMVVCAHPLAAKVGLEILKKGGNAVDATVAIQFALAVVYPRAGNIGGGGFMVIRNNDGTANTLDYREMAPSAASKDMYLDKEKNIIPKLSSYGHLSIGVPGSVAGLIEVQKKYGKLKDFSLLIQPAIDLAKNGFKLSITEINRLNKFRDDFLKYNENPKPFVKNEKWKLGDVLVQKELAKTLKLIRDKGKKGFYEGITADKIVAEMKSGKGIITLDDLKNYKPIWRKPIIGKYKDYKIISMGPPSSGGTALVQLLKIADYFPLKDYGFHTQKSIHVVAESERRVYADRAKHMGDMDFYNVPLDTLLMDSYLLERMKDFDPDHASKSSSILAGDLESQPMESFETTHTSVVDAQGNAVSVTTTLNSNFGSKVIVNGAGFFLNNEMDDFSAKPGVPNIYGLVGAEANAIYPGKRMLSSMTPTIIEKDHKLFMVLGAPGGSTIITAVYQVFLNVATFGMSLEDAVNAKRFHHQWLPDLIMVEKGFDPDVVQQLKDLGHKIKIVNRMAVVKAIHVLPNGQLNGVGDPRNPDDDAEGF